MMLGKGSMLRLQRLEKPAGVPPSGACWLSISSKLALLCLIGTNLVQLYLILWQYVPLCDGVDPCQTALYLPQEGRASEVEAVQAALPAVVSPEASTVLPFPDHHFAVFIIFSWNYEVFWTSLQTFMAAGWGKRVIIIDNSPDRLIVHDKGVNALVGEVIPTRVKLTFSQAQNMISDIAIERNYTFFFWGHSDVALLASNATAVFAEEVMACLETVMAGSPDWGILFFHYDWFSATRTDVAQEVKYDTFITVYKSDCDYYPRVRQKWHTLNHAGICKGCGVQVFDLKRGLKLPLDDYQATKAMLEAEANVKTNRNHWKKQQWSIGEEIGWDLWGQTSWHYFRYKWGATPPDKQVCRIEEPVEGEPGQQKKLRQQPFETVRDLLPAQLSYPVRDVDLMAKVQRMF